MIPTMIIGLYQVSKNAPLTAWNIGLVVSNKENNVVVCFNLGFAVQSNSEMV